jgi:hypothetical protein
MHLRSAALPALIILAVATAAGCAGGNSSDAEGEESAATGNATPNITPKKRKKPSAQPTGALAKEYRPGTTFAAVCGNTSYLAYKPEGWSNGCTGGSAHLNGAKWIVWKRDIARGVGTAGLRGACHPGCSKKDAYYEAPANVVLTEPRTCDDNGVELRYFQRARFNFYARPGNPLNEPVGWRHHDFKTFDGICTFTRY